MRTMLIGHAGLDSWILPVAAGPFAGSLSGVLVRRLPLGRPVAIARSACEDCGRVLSPAQLVPVVSYLWLRGRCAGCGSRIAPQHLYLELAATALAGWAAVSGLRGAGLWATSLFGWSLLALACIDWRHFRLPDALTLPLLLAGLGMTAWLQPAALTGHALASAGGYGLFRLVAATYRRARGHVGLGEGDAKLMAAIGAWLGIAGLSHTLLVGALLGLLLATSRGALRRGGLATPIPFGPCLAAGAWICSLYLDVAIVNPS